MLREYDENIHDKMNMKRYENIELKILTISKSTYYYKIVISSNWFISKIHKYVTQITYQNATNISAKVSNNENAANTIQYIIHLT